MNAPDGTVVTMRRNRLFTVSAVALILVAMVSVCLIVRVSPVFAETEAEQAAKEIADARERVVQASDAVFTAQANIEDLQLQNTQLESDISDLQDQIDQLQLAIQNVAIDRFTRSGSQGLPLLTGFQTPEEQLQIDVLINVVNASSDEDFDKLDSLSDDLVDKKSKLERQTQQAVDLEASLQGLRDQAEAEVERLKVVEAKRLQDEKVRAALEAELRERQRVAAEKLKNTPVAPISPSAPPASPGGAANPGGGSDSGSDPGTGGGQTGGGGSTGGGGGSATNIGPGWFCPTGPHSAPFSDTWGAPRSGGRRHQGVDMIGAMGTPLYAVVDGVAQAKSNNLGGITIWFTGTDGNKYYYAHLDRYGQLGSVAKGTVIGYIGQTGNARFSVPHLHFEIHPGGGAAVNPTSTARAHCPSAG